MSQRYRLIITVRPSSQFARVRRHVLVETKPRPGVTRVVNVAAESREDAFRLASVVGEIIDRTYSVVRHVEAEKTASLGGREELTMEEALLLAVTGRWV